MSTAAQPSPSPSPGTWLTRQMERRQASVRQIAEALEVTTQTVYDWRGDKAAINEARIPRLAEALGVSEVEARRGLGYWVPEGSEPQPARDTAELDEILQELTSVLEKFRHWRSGA
jgi:transcriptional regulator with XRE-family HTH domain